MPAPVAEPDRFAQSVNGSVAVGSANAANMRLLRQCFAASGIHSTKADHVVKAIQKRGGTYLWSATTPDALATQKRNWGYALTLAAEHKDTASTLVRTFALLGNGAGGPNITGFTVPANFKTPV